METLIIIAGICLMVLFICVGAYKSCVLNHEKEYLQNLNMITVLKKEISNYKDMLNTKENEIKRLVTLVEYLSKKDTRNVIDANIKI